MSDASSPTPNPQPVNPQPVNPQPVTTVALGDLASLVGTTLGPTEGVEVTQERVNTFATATGDHQWIHVDVERANAESPFGGPIAHGYLTLSLVNDLLPKMLEVTGTSMGVNVGVNKVRFPSPVPVGSLVRGTAEVMSVDEVGGGTQAVVRVSVTVDGAPSPAASSTRSAAFSLKHPDRQSGSGLRTVQVVGDEAAKVPPQFGEHHLTHSRRQRLGTVRQPFEFGVDLEWDGATAMAPRRHSLALDGMVRTQVR